MIKIGETELPKSDIWAFIAIFVSVVSAFYTYRTAVYTRQANIIAEQQTIIATQQKEIAQQQTDILDRQTEIQENSLSFEQDKHRTDTAKEYREKINDLYDKITIIDPILVAVHNKVRNWERVLDQWNLDRYVSEFENIWALFCDSKIKLADLRTILQSNLEYTCWNNQIYNHYQNTKSWLSGMCQKIFPWSSVMAKRSNPDKCPILRE